MAELKLETQEIEDIIRTHIYNKYNLLKDEIIATDWLDRLEPIGIEIILKDKVKD